MIKMRYHLISKSLLTEEKVKYAEGEFQGSVITGFEIGEICDFRVPFLWVKGETGEQRIPFYGNVFFRVSEANYCVLCYNKISENRTGVRICEKCSSTKIGLLFDCIWNSSLMVYGARCNPKEEPLCEDFKNALYCSSAHVLYIGLFGGILKVGVTRYSSQSSGRTYQDRIIEQGLDYAYVFHFKGATSLPVLQEMEAKISERFGFQTKITFNEKVEEIEDEITSNTKSKHKVLWLKKAAKEVKEYLLSNGLEVSEVEYFSLRDYYIIPKVESLYVLKHPLWVIGKIVGFKGHLIFMRRDDGLYLFNLYDLEGKRIHTMM